MQKMKVKIDCFKELGSIPLTLEQVLKALKNNATYVASMVKNRMTNYEEVFFYLSKRFFNSGHKVNNRSSAAE